MADQRLASQKERRERRRARVRSRISGTAARPRLSVFRSGQHIYAQVIDDESGKTLVACSTVTTKASGKKSEQADVVGKELAKLCKSKGIETVVFDRGGYLYHGRVKSLAEAARAEGLKF